MENNIEIWITPEQLIEIKDLSCKYFRGEVNRFEVSEIIYGMIVINNIKLDNAYIWNKNLQRFFDDISIIVAAEWREQQINSILED